MYKKFWKSKISFYKKKVLIGRLLSPDVLPQKKVGYRYGFWPTATQRDPNLKFNSIHYGL